MAVGEQVQMIKVAVGGEPELDRDVCPRFSHEKHSVLLTESMHITTYDVERVRESIVFEISPAQLFLLVIIGHHIRT